MKTVIVPLIGNPVQNLYQLGQREKEAFLKIERRVTKLLSTNAFLSVGQDIVSRTRHILRKKEDSFFDQCITAYAEGMGIEPSRYYSFLSLFEVAAHYGQVYPELKGMIPGCTSVFQKTKEGLTHSRLLDFPLIGIYEEAPRLYYWKPENKPSILSYSTEGMAPLFFQGIHESGISFALHHRPGKHYHNDGQSIFNIVFETLFESGTLNDFKREVKRRVSVTKWSFHGMDVTGNVQVIDIDGPAVAHDSYNVNETSPLIFTNIPIQNDVSGIDNFLKFSEDRQSWMKEKLSRESNLHPLDQMTDVEDQKTKKWLHPSATLSTVAAYHVNLGTGILDLKEGQSALVASDEIIRVSLGNHQDIKVLKKGAPLKAFEKTWKRMAISQSFFDQGMYDEAYHELQMAKATNNNPVWNEILKFYLHLWDFKFISNKKELSLIYKEVKKLDLPPSLKDQWVLLVMRLEKRLELRSTVSHDDVSSGYRDLFQQEKLAAKPVFATWMKLLYPRLEILDVFSPHRK